MPVVRTCAITDLTHTPIYSQSAKRDRYIIHCRNSQAGHQLYLRGLANHRRVRELVVTLKKRQFEFNRYKDYNRHLKFESYLHSPSYYSLF